MLDRTLMEDLYFMVSVSNKADFSAEDFCVILSYQNMAS